MRKISMKKKSTDSNSTESSDGPNKQDDHDTSGESDNNHVSKRSKRSSKRSRTSNNESNGTDGEPVTADTEASEENYEVEKVLDQKNVKGARHFLIRWKGYGLESDTWEPESTVDCPDLIEKFLNSKKSSNTKESSKIKESPKPSNPNKRSSKSDHKSPKKSKSNADGTDGPEEYEVDRIIEVHHKKNGDREFLVHWKGYTSTENTWEPEKNMSCPDLIEKFMAKVNKAKDLDSRELRTARKVTKPFTLSMEQVGRRLSRRNLGKQRIQYHDNE